MIKSNLPIGHFSVAIIENSTGKFLIQDGSRYMTIAELHLTFDSLENATKFAEDRAAKLRSIECTVYNNIGMEVISIRSAE